MFFLYFTEAPLGEFPIGNRVYKYELVNNKLVNPKVLLNLPAVRTISSFPGSQNWIPACCQSILLER